MKLAIHCHDQYKDLRFIHDVEKGDVFIDERGNVMLATQDGFFCLADGCKIEYAHGQRVRFIEAKLTYTTIFPLNLT